MDDLKLLGRNENELKNEMKIVQTISKDMNMNFVLEKCARICLKRGSVQSKPLKENLETIPGKHSIDSLQKTAILGTSHIIRKVLQCEA